MTPELRQNIIDELTKFLNRAPSEQEIQNCPTDAIIMEKIRQKEISDIKNKLKI